MNQSNTPHAAAIEPPHGAPDAAKKGWVTDAPTRMFHWLFAVAFVVAYISGDADDWMAMHVTAGYIFGGLFVFRGLYAWLGPRQASWAPLKRKAAGVWPWLKSLGQPGAKVNWRLGQNLALASSIVAVLVLVVPLVLSGYGHYDKWAGHWLKEVHEWFGTVALWAVLIHVGLLLLISAVRRQNHARPMLSGRAVGGGGGPIRARRRWLATLLLAAVLGFVWWQWQGSPTGLLPNPADRLSYDRDWQLDDDD